MLRPLLALAALLAPSSAPVAAAAEPAPGAFTLETLVAVRHPSRAVWSPDGQRLAFGWERSGVEDVYVVPAGGGAPAALTRHSEGLVGGISWTADGKAVLYEREGDLWRAPADGSAPPGALLATPEAESDFALAHDGRRLAFARDGDLYVRDLQDGREQRLTETPVAEAGPVWSPDDRSLAFVAISGTPHEESPDWVGAKLAFRSQRDFGLSVGVVPAAGGAVVSVAHGDGVHSSPRFLDAGRLTLQRVSADLKTREVLLADAATGACRVLFTDQDPRFWSLEFLGAEPVPSPDGRRVAFVSDRDGFDHLYVVDATGGEARQLTRGRFEVAGLAWSPDGRRIAFDANRGSNPGARELVLAELGATPRIITVAGGRGTHTLATFDPSGTRLLFQHTDPRSPADLFVAEAKASAPRTRLTTSLPEGVDPDALVEPSLVSYPSADGASVPAWLFVPKGLDRSRRHPAIVWVHGDGITQNFDGWHTRRDYAVYYSFHQYLVQRGYVVLAVDYRGSIGYGRDWRQGHYRDLGGRDYEDVAAGVSHLRSLGFVDEARVGIWGLSYGGFMALQAVTVTPELFRCAIDVAGVQDWRYWFADPDGPWIRGRLGTPDENPELYTRTSPIHQVERIVRPLLVLHGTADVNVPFLESVRLVDVLLKAGKDVEFAMYPGEFHYFQRAHVLRDAWRRVESFFGRHLEPDRQASPPD
jgi:dipeptidyl aminopeptidase/acylaminoacyl peptidase